MSPEISGREKEFTKRAAKQIFWCQKMLPRTLWPSGPRRWLKAPFRKGVGSNPTGVAFAGDAVPLVVGCLVV